MAVFKMNFMQSKGAAKAHIRYIQHRPGRMTGHAQAQRGHKADFCCGLFEMYRYDLGLPIDRDNPSDYIFHSRYCEIFHPNLRYDFDWYSRIREYAPHNDNIQHAATANGDKGGTAKGNGRERIARTLFGIDGAMGKHDAYRMVDEAEAGSSFFRIKICPDPKTEDTRRDLSLREVTETIMQTFEERIHRSVQWVAAEHDDHTPKRHVHVLAMARGRLNRQDLQSIIQKATEACLEQRRALDLAQKREGEEWERSV